MNATHDPARGSWVASAHRHPHFPLQNLPFGVARRDPRGQPRVMVAIGDAALDLPACIEALPDLIPARAAEAARAGRLNALMALPVDTLSALRHVLHDALWAGAPADVRAAFAPCLVSQASLALELPADIRGFTDGFTSLHHARHVAEISGDAFAVPPAFTEMPLAYHGRASTIVPSGVPVRRPRGQRRSREGRPIFGPSRRLDYEVEIGVFVRGGNAIGMPIPIDRAWDHVFGVVLLNDWSARDLQAWEAQPLGPFAGKNFATSISPWVVTAEALDPFRVPAAPRAVRPLDYLWSVADDARGGLQIEVDAWLHTASSRAGDRPPVRLSAAPVSEAVWTIAQQIAQYTANGCRLEPGDLLGSGTISGPAFEQGGCLLEITRGGRHPLILPGGETRTFLEDGDEVVLVARAEAAGAASIGFGECRATVEAAHAS